MDSPSLATAEGSVPILLPPASDPRLPDLPPATGLLVPMGVSTDGSTAVLVPPSVPPRHTTCDHCRRLPRGVPPRALTSRGLCRALRTRLTPGEASPPGCGMVRSTAQAFQSPSVCDPRARVLGYGALPRWEGGHVLGSSPIWCGWPASSLQPREHTSQQLLRASRLRENLQGTGGPRLCSQGLFQAGGCSVACLWGVDQP